MLEHSENTVIVVIVKYEWELLILKNRSAFLLLIPGVLSICLFLFFPLFQTIWPTIGGSGYSDFLHNGYNRNILGRTLLIAVITTVLALGLGLPLALWIARQKAHVKSLLSVVILFPILTNAVVRNFTWIIILGKDGVLNRMMLELHLIQHPVTLLYTNAAIVVGSVYLFLPIMVTSLIGSIEELNIEVEEAAAVLGAKPWTTLTQVIVPQLTTGILTGSILVFAGAMTAYTTPQLLGGNRHLVMSTLIYQQAMTLGDWRQASIVAVILIVMTVLVMVLMRLITHRLDRRPSHA